MSGATDSGMVKTMGLVMAAVTALALICMVAARLLGIGADDSDDPLKRNALIQRIEPVASVRTSADDLPAASQGVMEVASGPKTGEELVNGACAACHIAGVAGAPKLDDAAAWAERRESGLDALVASVINGKGSMPARGGSTYSDEEITLAVQQMAGFEVEETSAAPAADATEETETAEAPAEQTDTTAQAPAAETSEEPVAETAEEAAATEEAAPASEESASAAALVVGQVPEGLTDNIKANVDGVCAACHIAGVANAPKLGDREAWQLRADKGLDALVASVTNGLNAMPARGGSALTDEEIPIAIQYLMSK